MDLSRLSYKALHCNKCNRLVEKVSIETEQVICFYCLLSKMPPPEIKIPKLSSDRPRGWHFMKVFVDKKGNVFYRGVEQPKLKGTLPPTEIKKTIKKPKKTKEEKLVARYKKKKEALRKIAGTKLGRPKKRGRPKGSTNKKKKV